MKKKTKKALALALCAVMLVAGTALTTIAYLTSEDSVTNTFTVGKVNITLDETDVDVYGVKDGDTRVKANTYKIIPGVPYIKDPTVTVLEGSEDCYVRMIVTISDFTAIKNAFGNDFLPQYFVQGWDPTVWLTTNEVKVDQTKNTATYEFRYKEIVNTVGATVGLKLDALFDTFTVPGTVTELDLKEINANGFTINIEAHAIQAAGFNAVGTEGDTGYKSAEDVAWEAFDTQRATEAYK